MLYFTSRQYLLTLKFSIVPRVGFFFVSLRFSILQFLFNFNYSDDEERGDNFLGMYLILTNLSSREHPHSANNTILKIYIDI